jgi:hypothetical protein
LLVTEQRNGIAREEKGHRSGPEWIKR